MITIKIMTYEYFAKLVHMVMTFTDSSISSSCRADDWPSIRE